MAQDVSSGIPLIIRSSNYLQWEWEPKSEFPLRLDYGRSPHAYVNQRLQIQLELLMMSGMPLETCWSFNERWNNKFYYKVASCWLFLLSELKKNRKIYKKFKNITKIFRVTSVSVIAVKCDEKIYMDRSMFFWAHVLCYLVTYLRKEACLEQQLCGRVKHIFQVRHIFPWGFGFIDNFIKGTLCLLSTTHCSLLRLIVRSGLDVPTFATRRLHACHHARVPSGGR